MQGAMSGFDYSKWNNIELSDDEEDLHPNIDKDSWFRLKHRTRVEREEDEAKNRKVLEKKLQDAQKELEKFGEAGKGHLKAQKLQQEIERIEAELARLDKQRKWNADNMCKTDESRTVVSAAGPGPAPGPEPRLRGEAAAEGYCEFVEEHEALLEEFIELGAEEDLEKVADFLRRHGGTLLQGEHAESYLLLDCLEKEMNGEHEAMLRCARQNQLLTQLREFSRAAGRPARDGVNPVFQRLLDHEETRLNFEETVADFARRVEKRAVEKKKEMDAEDAEENPRGPGGLDPMEVFRSLPQEMRSAFQAQDMQRLQAALESLPKEEAKRHMQRCEDSGLWVPSPEAGPPPYRQ